MSNKQARLHLIDAVALAALAITAGFALATLAVALAGGIARRLADAVAIGRAGMIAAPVVAAILARLTTIVWRADALADLRVRADALVRG
jgi:hypothetical protein